MPNVRRYGFGLAGTIVLAIGGIMYQQVFRGGLYDLAVNQHSGPFSVYVETLDAIAPVILVALLLALWAWVLVGGAREERARGPVR